uniref:Uncharacterized protein n=1 Tax=Anguilla anguilla TaxID=7936 RepID=A0A0E9VIC8_ANGAN
MSLQRCDFPRKLGNTSFQIRILRLRVGGRAFFQVNDTSVCQVARWAGAVLIATR